MFNFGHSFFPYIMKKGEMIVKSDTIAAPATALSSAGIGIIRISGEESIAIADKIFCAKNGKKLIDCASHTIHYGYIMDGGKKVDEVLVMLMKAPNSYTREDTVEIDCHGGMFVMQKILDAAIHSGARIAEPGEFTKRAFLNGRIDLAQAESVIDIIQAKNDFAWQSSVDQLSGSLSKKIRQLRETIINETAFIESALDDPEHYSLDEYPNKLLHIVHGLKQEIQHLIDTADQGKILKEGINTVIVGKPNVGKSSILNVLVGDERAIVTDVAGTTRDALEEQIQLDGISLNIIDTAGIRQTDDLVEKIGVEKAKGYLDRADLVLYVIDSSIELTEEDLSVASMLTGKNVIVILNKSDLEQRVSEQEIASISSHVISVSAKDGDGIPELTELIRRLFLHGELTYNDQVVVTNLRHKNALIDSLESMELVENSIQNGMPEDFYSIDLMNAYDSLGAIIGESLEDDLADKIFSKFCMGK